MIQEWLDRDWPLKLHEGSISVSRTAAGNPEARYEAIVTFYIYSSTGFSQPKGEFANGKTAEEALEKLWDRTIIKVRKMVEAKVYIPLEVEVWYKRYVLPLESKDKEQ